MTRPTPKSTQDLLLFAARAVIVLLLFLTVSAALLFVMCIPLALLRPELALAMLVGHPIGDLPSGAPPLMAGIIAAGLLMFLGIVYSLKQLLDIVGSVASGDPFVSANADRLTRMAWVVLAVRVGLPIVLEDLQLKLQQFPTLAESILVIPTTHKSITESGDNGLFLALVLFVLARVFRKGAQMRADLEGTV